MLCRHKKCKALCRIHADGSIGSFCPKHECHATGCKAHRCGHETFVDQCGRKQRICSNYCMVHRCNYLHGMSGGIQCHLGKHENGHVH